METKKRRLAMRTVVLALIIAALIYTLCMSFFKEKKDIISIGDEAPNFILKDMNGVEFQLSNYKGKGVFLNFWGTYCGPCKKEMPYMNNVFKEYQADGVEILAINIGEAELRVNNFIDQYGLDFPILYDRGGTVTNLYDFIPLPTTFLIDKDGMIVDIISGTLSEASIRASMDKIKPTS
ncbi:thiol-disulfide oxidoreductase ResA [Lysinibacillus sp. NPDC048646]|uniref:thiol-disulfide oxidoreductase ResA n=1 Tax=Lysinibacillus sp. NPDC048646 TaxID=3390574 RepID=UPI003CFEA1A1